MHKTRRPSLKLYKSTTEQTNNTVKHAYTMRIQKLATHGSSSTNQTKLRNIHVHTRRPMAANPYLKKLKLPISPNQPPQTHININIDERTRHHRDRGDWWEHRPGDSRSRWRKQPPASLIQWIRYQTDREMGFRSAWSRPWFNDVLLIGLDLGFRRYRAQLSQKESCSQRIRSCVALSLCASGLKFL